QVVSTAPPAGLPPLPALAAKWDQTSGNTAAPAGTTTLAGGPLIFTASAPLVAPGVYATIQLNYQLTAWYDLDADGILDPGEPTNQATVTLTIQPRNLHILVLVDRSGSMVAFNGPRVTR